MTEPGPAPTADWFALSGARALVLGGSGGIGAACVELLGTAGARVCSLDLPGRPPPEGAEGVAVDAARPDDVSRAVAAASDRLGGLDLVVHAAGVTADGLCWKLTDDDWRRVLAVNLDSAFWLLRAATPHLRASAASGRAAVVFIASINGERGKRGQANYAASKGGLIALAKTAARELGHFGIRVNAIAPGFIKTPMTASLPDEVRERARAESVLGRLGTPDDVARAVVFLCSALGRHVTGQVLRVDGGQLIV